MQESNDKLFLLVFRLTPSEKGYLSKRFKASNPKSNILKLFIAISKFKPSTDADLKNNISDSYILKNLAVVKNQLFERILRIQRDYRGDKGKLREVLLILEDIEFLFEKGIHDECKKMIKKAIKICDNNEFYGLKLHLLDWEKRIMSIYFYTYKSLDEELQRFENTLQESLKKAKLIGELDNRRLRIYVELFHKKWGKTVGEAEHKLKELDAYLNQIMKSEKFEDSSRMKIIISNMLITTLFKREYVDQVVFDSSKLIQSVEGELHPLSIETYFESLFKLLGHCAATERKDIYKNTITSIKNANKNFSILKKYRNAKMSIICYQIQHSLYEKGQFDEQKTKELSLFLDHNTENAPQGGWLCFNLGRYYFFYGKLALAQSYILKALTLPKSYRLFFECNCRYLYLMTLVELQHYNDANRILRELKRYLRKNDLLTTFHKNLTNFFKEIIEEWHQKKYDVWIETLNRITPEDDFEVKFLFRDLQINTWLKAKENKMTMIEYQRFLMK